MVPKETQECDSEVSKKFLLQFSNFKTSLFTLCRVCRGRGVVSDETSVVQIEPTFSRQLQPEYSFDHTYDFVMANLTFAPREDVSTKVNVTLELHVCQDTLAISFACSGSSPSYFVSLMADATDKDKVQHQITQLSTKVTCGQKRRLVSSQSHRLFRRLFLPNDLFVSVQVRVFYPWTMSLAAVEKPLTLMSLSGRIILVTRDLKAFSCSKHCLAQGSEVFRRMLASPMEESRNSRVYLKQFDSEAVENFIRFIETREFDCYEKLEVLAELLYMSDMYLVGKLRTECESRLLNLITPTNVNFITLLAFFFSAEMLKRGILDFQDRQPTNTHLEKNIFDNLT